MAMVVNQEKCNGCGVCVDYCPMEAIRLIDGTAQIDQNSCRECEACLSACPTGAISAVVSTPQPILQPDRVEVVKVNPQKTVPASSITKTKTNNWANIILALLSSELIPRMSDILNTVLEQKSRTNQVVMKSSQTKDSTWNDSGRQRRMRHRAQYRNRRYSNIRS